MKIPILEGAGDSVDRLMPAMWSRFGAPLGWIILLAILLAVSGVALVYLAARGAAAMVEFPALAQTFALMLFTLATLAFISATVLYRYAKASMAATHTKSTNRLLVALRMKEKVWRFTIAVFFAYVIVLTAIVIFLQVLPGGRAEVR